MRFTAFESVAEKSAGRIEAAYAEGKEIQAA